MGRKRKLKQRSQQRSDHERTMRQIRGALSLDLLHPDYAPDDDAYVAACTGHCYVATEAAYHLFAKQAGYVPYVYKRASGSHWWLVKEDTGDILDPSLPQLGGTPFPYRKGHRQSFVTKAPSKRAKELIRRVRAAINR